ncbi:ABC transporter ATP-binding protein [Gynuella sunshinyii]|uniref:ABC-type cobalamin/Fe3+-siderophores transport system, ATPase component n=1 Tax=Gynuella sunshinyii YC6258 TaxID=1445510 RepID=A0A0C5VJ86_9GAMM|nr:ABC transporter ATP-binding protein [Gynuella sunshinyii]AJQ94321.1 ABC-type cobalamin/Fe3+-siderophores transport system, ATPase component [Gynuella sunshinyii YC6258]
MDLQCSHTHQKSRLHGDGLSVGYGDRTILQGVDFAVADGRLTVLVGPNGSGKSTLLKTMARILAPKSGQVLLDGKDIHQTRTREVAKKLGLLPQGPTAPDGLTVRELVAQGRFPHQSLLRQWSSEDERAVNQAMETAQVSGFADRPVDDLSGGQRQRCWIAMVLAQQTDLILLDEPTTFLDLKVQVDLMQMLVRLAHERGHTLVVVLHELNLAAAYADTLVMMREGRIVESGPPERVFNRENLKTVFDLDANVIRDPHSGSLLCVPVVMATDGYDAEVAGAIHES